MTKTKSNSLGIVSLILGIYSITRCLSITGTICGVLGIIFATQQQKSWSNGIAKAGFITSVVGLSLSVFLKMGLFIISFLF